MSKSPPNGSDNPLAELVAELNDLGDLQPAPQRASATRSESVAEPKERVQISEPELTASSRSLPEVESRPTTTPKVQETESAASAAKDDLQSRAVAAIEAKSQSAKAVPTHPTTSTPRLGRSSTQNREDQIGIPPRTGAATALASSHMETPQPPARRRLMIGAAALLVLAGTGYVYVQGSQPASSEAVVYEVPIYDDAVETVTTPDSIGQSASDASASLVAEVFEPTGSANLKADETSNPTRTVLAPKEIVAAVAPATPAMPIEIPVRREPLGFDEKFSDEFPELEGQSLLDLATGVPKFAPANIVPNREWDEVSCGGCHTFDQANLCEQGAYYFNHDEARINRIQHPYGGGFKQKLMQWAEGGCQ